MLGTAGTISGTEASKGFEDSCRQLGRFLAELLFQATKICCHATGVRVPGWPATHGITTAVPQVKTRGLIRQHIGSNMHLHKYHIQTTHPLVHTPFTFSQENPLHISSIGCPLSQLALSSFWTSSQRHTTQQRRNYLLTAPKQTTQHTRKSQRFDLATTHQTGQTPSAEAGAEYRLVRATDGSPSRGLLWRAYLLFCSFTLLLAPLVFFGDLGSLLGLVVHHLLLVPVGATQNAPIMQTNQGERISSSTLSQ